MKKLLTLVFAGAVGVGAWVHTPTAKAQPKAATKREEKIRITKGPVIEWIGAKDAVIAWSTNVRSSTTLRYGTDKNSLNETARAPWGEATHRVHLRNLKPGTRYFFVADSGQAQGSTSDAATSEGILTTVAAGQKGKQYPNGRG